MNLLKIKDNQNGMATKSLIITISILLIVLCIAFFATMIIDGERNANIKRMQSKELNYKFSLFGNNYTKEDLKVFLESANDCENYSFNYYEYNNLVTGKVFNNKFYYTTSDKEVYYDKDSNTYITISKKNKTYEISHKKLDNNCRNVLANIVLTLLNCNDIELKYIKDETYNNFECIVERITLKDFSELKNLISEEQLELLKQYQEKGLEISYDFWIEKASGLLAKYDIVLISKNKEENRIEFDTNLSISTVKENDIIEPNSKQYEDNGYTIIKE